MRVTDIPEIAQLSTPEKILLVEDLWEYRFGRIIAYLYPKPQGGIGQNDWRAMTVLRAIFCR